MSDEYIKDVYEQFFLLKYYGGWSLFETYNMPIGLRTWFVNRLAREIEKQNKEQEKAMRKAKSS